MARKTWLALMVCCCLALTARAESTRTLLVQDNKYPDSREFEVGVSVDYAEDTVLNNDVTGVAIAPYCRYGVPGDRLTASVAVPYLLLEGDFIDDDQGPGDVLLGLDLSAFNDEYGNQEFITPYLRVSLPTGDEGKGLGTGETIVIFGTSFGSTVAEWYTLVLDASYTFQPDEDNLAALALAVIWDASEIFALSLECMVTDEKDAEGDFPYYVTGTMRYKATDDLSVLWGGGFVENSTQEVVASVRVSYTF